MAFAGGAAAAIVLSKVHIAKSRSWKLTATFRGPLRQERNL